MFERMPPHVLSLESAADVKVCAEKLQVHSNILFVRLDTVECTYNTVKVIMLHHLETSHVVTVKVFYCSGPVCYGMHYAKQTGWLVVFTL